MNTFMLALLCMIASLEFLLAEECKSGWTFFGHTGKCYKSFETRVTRAEAIRVCKASVPNANLVSIPDLKTNEFVKSIMKGSKNWIALENKNGKWIWPDGSENSLNNWFPGNPSGDGSFAEIYAGQGLWNDLGVTWRGRQNLRGSMCQYDLQGPISTGCKSGWTLFGHTGICYKSFDTRVSRADAIKGCKASVPNANLVSIPDLKTNQFVRSIMKGSKSWIALEKKNGKWIWPDGSENSLNNWFPGNPSGDGSFAEIYAGQGLWNDLGVTWRGNRNLRGSVCQYDPRGCTCGETHTATRIVGGNPTLVNEYPWQAGILILENSNKQPSCGGSIISKQYILTAAHCIYEGNRKLSASEVEVALGEHDTEDSERVVFKVSEIFDHPLYDDRKNIYDVAILKLSSTITFSSIMSPVCLPATTSNNYEGRVATVTGWGRLGEDDVVSTILQEVNVRVTDTSSCKNSYLDLPFNQKIDIKEEIHICAASTGKDSCSGDSGGPLVLREGKNNRFTEIGVVSFGFGCARPKYPGVYVRISDSEIKNWIKKIASGTEDSC